MPGTLMATVGTMERTTWGLEEWRAALEDAVRRRPNWAEGYLRLGLVHMGLYRQKAKEWLEDAAVDANEIDRMAEPLWLLATLRDDQAQAATAPSETDVLGFEPIRSHLVPAVNYFLEARRCCPFLALPHAELASLSYLLVRGDPASTYATRALGLSGNDGLVLGFLAEVAYQAGDRKLAARSWRKKLEANPANWPEVADQAVIVLSADELLSDLVADGRDGDSFRGSPLHARADQQHECNQFLQTAMERLALDREIEWQPERLYQEVHASAGLALSEQACERMTAALAQQPGQTAWRLEYINWLLQWRRHKQSSPAGRYPGRCRFSPDSEFIRAAVDRTAPALARGGTEP